MSNPEIDLVLMLTRLRDIAKRLCTVEGWKSLAMDLIEHCGDDIIKLEERVDTLEDELSDLRRNVVELKLQLGTAIESHEVDA